MHRLLITRCDLNRELQMNLSATLPSEDEEGGLVKSKLSNILAVWNGRRDIRGFPPACKVGQL